MPYFISDKNADCSGWAVEKEDGEVIGCHITKQDAIDQMRMEKQGLVDEISRADQGYRDHAKSKLERKLKAGSSAQLAEKHQNSVDAQRVKLTSTLEDIRAKITNLEKEKEAVNIRIDSKIAK